MKKIITYLLIISLSIVFLTGCEININLNKNSSSERNNIENNDSKEENKTSNDPIESGVNIINSSTSSARSRSVEGHIKNIEYAALEAAFKDGSGDTKKIDGTYNSQESLDKALKNEGVTISTSDKIICAYYKIVEGTIIKASGCKESGWSKSYKYTQGEKTVEE